MFAATLAGGPAAAGEAAWQGFLSRWGSTPTWSAEFSQRIDLGDGSPALLSYGRILLSRPGRIRWEYEDGPAQLVVGDGVWLWVYQPDLEQVYKVSYDSSPVSAMMAVLLGDAGPLERAYQVSGPGSDDGDRPVFRLSPRDGSGPDIELTAAAGGSELAAVVVTEDSGTRNEVLFTEAVRDAALDASLFSFAPPPGTDVITHP